MNATGSNTIQRNLWVLRAYYFLWLGGAGCINPFLNLFFVRQNLSGVEIGWMVSLGALVALVAAPLWTRLSLKVSRPLRLLQAAMGLLAVLTLLLGAQTAFLWLTLVYALRVMISAGLSPLSDSLAVKVSEAARTGFGSIRVWGSLGWAVFVLSSGWLVERTSLHTAFWGYAIALTGAGLVLFNLRGRDHTHPTPQPRLPMRQVASGLLRNPLMVGLAVMLIINGLANLGVGQFENVYLDQLGARESLIGIASMVSSVVELPGMLWADTLVRRKNPAWLLLIAVLMTASLRALVFFFPGVATIIAARAIGGISFSFTTVALVKLICKETPAEGTATALAIFTVTLPGLINMTGTPLAGLAFDALGAHWLYLVSLSGYLLGAAALFSGIRMSKEKYQHQ